jgi:hypothetical protein
MSRDSVDATRVSVRSQDSKTMKLLNYLMTACFLFSVIVQLNDPDPIRWIVIYGLAAAACAWAIRGRVDWRFPAAVGAVALSWALWLASSVLGKVRFGELFEAFEMKDTRVEVGREFGGLLIVAAWMAVLAFHEAKERIRNKRK